MDEQAHGEHDDEDLTITFTIKGREIGFTLPRHGQHHFLVSMLSAARYSPFARVETNTLSLLMSALILEVADAYGCGLGAETNVPTLEEVLDGLERPEMRAKFPITINRMPVPDIFKEAFK